MTLTVRRQVTTPPRAASLIGRTPAPGEPCTPQTGRCTAATDYRVEMPGCCRAHLIGIVRDTVHAFELCDVTWWADYGTLLGAVRNPLTTWADYSWLPQGQRSAERVPAGIIPHDKDADIGALFVDWHAIMRARAMLEGKGYHVHVNQHAGKLKIRLSVVNHTNLDVFTWREVGGKLYRPPHSYITVDQFKGRDFLRHELEPMSRVAWEGLTLNAPRDPEAFCAFRYGTNWRTPIPSNHDGVRRGRS